MRQSSSVNLSPEDGTPGFDAGAVTAWLDLLHGTSQGYLNICSTADWTGRCFQADEIDQAVQYAKFLDRSGAEGIYVRTTTLASIPGQHKRGSIEDSMALPGFALDLDIAGPGHKTAEQLPPDVDACMWIIENTGLPTPSAWVHSGGGVYPWWLLEEPYDVSQPSNRIMAEQIASGLEKVTKHAADGLGWHFGVGVRDLARVLRLPGTVNRKKGLARQCRILEPASYEFYTITDLYATVMDLVGNLPADKVAQTRPAPKPIQVTSDISPGDAMELAWDWIDILGPYGWRIQKRLPSGEVRWIRPGKDTPGHSASTGLASDRDRLFVLSSDDPTFRSSFDVGPYTKFHAYALLNHGGDHSAAARSLRGLGFGGERPQQQQTSNLAGLVKPESTRSASTQVEVVGSEQVQPVQQLSPVGGTLVQTGVVLDHHGLPVFGDGIISRHKWRDTGLVDMYVEAFGPGLRYVAAEEEWMIWDGRRWTPDVTHLHKFAAQQLLQLIESTADKAFAEGHEHGKAMVEAAKKMATMTKMTQLPNAVRVNPKIATRAEQFDSHLNLVTVDNGILDLKTGELHPFDPSRYITKKLNTAFNPDATDERLDKFLAGVMPDQEVRDYVGRCAAATLFGRADERIIMFLYGESGTGKSAFLEMLVKLFGDYAAVADEATFKPDPYDGRGPTDRLHKLKGSRLVKMSELQEGAVLNQSLIKNVTGMDTQSTRPLYGKLVEWKVQYVAWLATNHLPRLSSNDGAIWKRVKPIHFPNQFVDPDTGEVLNSADKDIGSQLARDAGPAILNWLLGHLADYLANGLQEPAAIGQWLRKYRDETDTTRQFVAEAAEADQIVVAETVDSGVRELYRAYVAWCTDNQVKPVASNNFTTRMESNGWKRERREKGTRWVGIGLKGMIAQAQLPMAGLRRRE
jgi:putative DNA primase/helicase